MSAPWTEQRWARVERAAARQDLCKSARLVLRSFSSSFFLVTRFLPPAKRAQVELIYAAVRYPDEIVDTFPLSASAKIERLDAWELAYLRALDTPAAPGTPWILAGFAEVCRNNGIPREHYQSFLYAMRMDTAPQQFQTLDSLIETYIYGSATVVGYFLAHVYGTAPGATLPQAYESARDLAIALQLTNFARDAQEDLDRGRLYMPTPIFGAEGLAGGAIFLAKAAEGYYERAARSLNVFAPDTRPAIKACIDVYGLLNSRLISTPPGTIRRLSVPAREKFAALPPDKYWRVPLAYLGAI